MRSVKGLPLPVGGGASNSDFGCQAHSKPKFARESANIHPGVDVLEEYYFDRLNPLQRQSFESHLAQCDSCKRALADFLEFIVNLSLAIPMCRIS